MPEITEMIEEWSSGYLFYIEELTKWVVIQMEEDPRASFEILISRLRTVIEENDVIPIFKYCFAAWNLIKANKQLLDILYRAAKIGMVIDASQNANQLMKMGLLLEFDPRSQPDLYRIPNKIIEMFIRQRFAELGMLLPIRESMIWGVEKQNLRAYSILLDIENHLRNYIGDTLFGANKTKWIKSLDIKSDDGSNILGKLEKRKKEDIESIYSTSGTSDPLLSYLDFGDLATFIETHKANFPKEFSDKAPNFLKELNYHRRRIAHSRPMTIEQIKSVEITWKQIQKMMAKKG